MSWTSWVTPAGCFLGPCSFSALRCASLFLVRRCVSFLSSQAQECSRVLVCLLSVGVSWALQEDPLDRTQDNPRASFPPADHVWFTRGVCPARAAPRAHSATCCVQGSSARPSSGSVASSRGNTSPSCLGFPSEAFSGLGLGRSTHPRGAVRSPGLRRGLLLQIGPTLARIADACHRGISSKTGTGGLPSNIRPHWPCVVVPDPGFPCWNTQSILGVLLQSSPSGTAEHTWRHSLRDVCAACREISAESQCRTHARSATVADALLSFLSR